METKFNFKSAICTSRFQSERLLALGLKPETADCYLVVEKDEVTVVAKPYYEIIEDLNGLPFDAEIIPAWSLHRLIEMMPECLIYYGNLHYISIREHQVKYVMDGVSDGYFGCWGGYTLYDKVINCIDWLIKEGDFNKEYLV